MNLSAQIAGIEIVGDEVRVVVVKTGGKLPVIVESQLGRALYAGPEDQAEALAAALKAAVGALKSRPAVFILCVSSLHSAVRTLTVPFRGKKRVTAAVPFELEPFLAIPIDEMIVDFSVVRERDGKTEVLAVGMRQTHLEEQIALLKAAGVDPDGIHLDAAGLTALWWAQQTGKRGMAAVLHVREQGSILAIVNGATLAYFRYLSISAAQLLANPIAAAREAQNSLRAFQAAWKGETAIEALTVTGVELREELRAIFEEGIHVPVKYEQLAQPLKGAEHLPPPHAFPQPGEAQASEAAPPPAGGTRNYWEAVIGCAAAAAGNGMGFDFRKDSLAKAGTMRGVITHGVFSAVLVLVAIIGYGVYCFIDYRHNMAEMDRISRQAWELFQKSFPASEHVAKGPAADDLGGDKVLGFFTEEMEKLSNAEELSATGIKDMLSKPTLLDLLAEIAAALPGDTVQVNRLQEVKGQNSHLRIEGETTDLSVLNAGLEQLKQSTLFTIRDEPAKQVIGDKTRFTIKAIL